MRRILLALAVLTLVGCSPAVPTPSPAPTPSHSPPLATAAPNLVRPFSDGDGRPWRLLVWDPASLLSDVQQVSAGEYRGENISWDPVAGSPESVVVVWMGGVCTTDRGLTVAKQASHVSLTVLEGRYRLLAPNEACPGVGIIYRLLLTFQEPTADIDISVAYVAESP